jgi:hypothetical protein
MYPHRIRLAQPWDRLDSIEGTVRLRRRFGRPRQLDEWERVWLIPAPLPESSHAIWQLNAIKLEWSGRGDQLARANVTANLKDRNELLVEMQSSGDEIDFGGAVLEIGCRAYIDNVRWHSFSVNGALALAVAVDVMSESADDPLELYVLIDGESYGYRGPLAIAGLTTHEFRLDERTFTVGANVLLRIELICRSTVWDAVELNVTSIDPPREPINRQEHPQSL